MSVKIEKKKEGKVEYVSYSKKEDYKAITLKSDGKIYVEHIALANRLIKNGQATEAKDVKFTVESGTSKFIETVEK